MKKGVWVDIKNILEFILYAFCMYIIWCFTLLMF